jgi:hypothetical protein
MEYYDSVNNSTIYAYYLKKNNTLLNNKEVITILEQYSGESKPVDLFENESLYHFVSDKNKKDNNFYRNIANSYSKTGLMKKNSLFAYGTYASCYNNTRASVYSSIDMDDFVIIQKNKSNETNNNNNNISPVNKVFTNIFII